MAKGNKLSGLIQADAIPTAPGKANSLQERKWKAEEALRCLTRAAEIRRDAQLMRDVKVLAAEQMKQLKSINSQKASGR